MIIQIDKEAEKLLTEIVDGYTKHVGLRGIGNVNVLMQNLKIVEAPTPSQEPGKSVPVNETPEPKPEVDKAVLHQIKK